MWVIERFKIGIIDALTIFDIRKIHNTSELELIGDRLYGIFIRNNDFKGKIHNIHNFWLDIVSKEVSKTQRNIQYMIIFFEAIDLLGIKRLMALKERGIKLSGADFFDLEVKLKVWKSTKKIDMQEFVSNLIKPKMKRRIILITGPKSDHNLAFGDILSYVKTFQKDKFKVYLSFISSPTHLAKVIWEVAKNGKIDFLMIGGHGNPHGTDFDYMFDPKSHLTEETLKSPLFNNIKKCFSNNAKCYLRSCSTGALPEGIAYQLSKRLGIEVIAPKVNESGREIIVSPTGDIKLGSKKGGAMASFKP